MSAPAPVDNASHKSWVFTLNNWTPEELDNCLHWEVSRMAVAEEVGEETGTPHLQGMVTFRFAKRLAAVSKLLSRAHWEVAKQESWDYQHKDGNVVHRIDNRVGKGKRTDLDAVYEYGAAKRSFRDFVRDCKPGYQALRMYSSVLDVYSERRDPATRVEVCWWYGPTGTGKTRAAHDEYPGLYVVLSAKWWDGYGDGAEGTHGGGGGTVLVDDVRFDWCPWARLLTLTDRYPFRVECKGRSVEARFSRIIFTCPYHFRDVYAACGEDVGQLARRITEIRRFSLGGGDGGGGGGGRGVVELDRVTDGSRAFGFRADSSV